MMGLADKVNNVYLHMDDAFGGQCWDAAAWFMNYFGLPVINTGNTRTKSGRWPGWAGNMVDCFPQSAEIAAAYELVAPDQPILPMDTLVWDDSNRAWFPATHVATAIKDVGNGWVLCWSQNSSAGRPDLPGYDDEASGPTIMQHLPKKGLLGIIRPRTSGLSYAGTATTETEDEEMTPQQMQEIKDFVFVTVGTLFDQYHGVTRSHIVGELSKKIESSEYDVKLFAQASDNFTGDRIIHDNRAQEQATRDEVGKEQA
jgi:hypothetical protein